MGLAFSRVFQRLFSKQEMRILMVTIEISYSQLTKLKTTLEDCGFMLNFLYD